jgi:hypothetical protein
MRATSFRFLRCFCSLACVDLEEGSPLGPVEFVRRMFHASSAQPLGISFSFLRRHGCAAIQGFSLFAKVRPQHFWSLYTGVESPFVKGVEHEGQKKYSAPLITVAVFPPSVVPALP